MVVVVEAPKAEQTNSVPFEPTDKMKDLVVVVVVVVKLLSLPFSQNALHRYSFPKEETVRHYIIILIMQIRAVQPH